METVDEYRVKVTVRNNLILKAIEDMGYTNLNKFATAEKISLEGLYGLVNLKKAPIGVDGEFSKPAKELMEVLGACPTDLWTEEQLTLTLRKNSEERQLSKEAMQIALQSGARSLIGLPYDEVENKQREKVIFDILETITPRCKQILSLRFGLDGEEEHSLEETAEIMGNVTGERIRQIEARTFRHLRHPSRADKLKDFLDD
jgi:RNA polymerase sigma factor (sigma-70 family)